MVLWKKPDKMFARLVKSPANVWSAMPLPEVKVDMWYGVSADDFTGSILFLRS